jgi:AraC-like DNA-binding protein
MIRDANMMIAGCIDRLRHDACGSCERKGACADLFSGLFGPGGAFARRAEPRREPPAARDPGPSKNPFLSFLGQVAKAIEAAAEPRTAPKPGPSPLRSEVEQRLEPMLAAGGVRIDEMARALGLSRQTLYRRLKAEGVTFEEILDRLRRRLALRMLREERLSVKETAYRLGFSDPAAFSRAFKRWTGQSPSGAQR